MSKIKIEDIKAAAKQHGWTLLSTEYKNLDTELTFECSEGHRIFAPYKKVRNKWECPICKENKYFPIFQIFVASTLFLQSSE